MKRFKNRVLVQSLLLLTLVALSGLTNVGSSTASAQNVTVQRNPRILQQDQHNLSEPLGEIIKNMPSAAFESRTMIEPGHFRPPIIGIGPDAAEQREPLPKLKAKLLQNFAGVGQGDYGYSDSLTPPDTNASVGDTQVVEFVNDSFAIFDKTTGALIAGPTAGSAFWTGLGGPCAAPLQGDIIIKYDQLAQRWVALYLAFEQVPYYICSAVSTTSDATSSYNQYSMSFGDNLPDYPKLSVWPDAYYLNTNVNGGYADACALNRTAMLSGQPMTAQCFTKTNEASFLPSDVDGAGIATAGEPAFFVDLATSTSLHLYKFHVDFTNPNNTTFTGPTSITVASYTSACGGFGQCIPQPAAGQTLDSLADRLMYRLAYRNFGDHESLFVTHSVTPSSGSQVSALRWYEIQNPDGTPVIAQQGTYANNKASLWMGSIASDKANNLLLGFSGSSTAVFPFVGITGRLSTDPQGAMETLKTLKAGAGSQEYYRWGDYSSMALDPTDDCTFWYTTEYMKTTTGANAWSSQLSSLRFPACN
jgi:hypothetical protein